MSDKGMSQENLRKTIHVAMGGFALLLRWLTPFQASLCAIAAFLHNYFILPRTLGKRIYRKEEIIKGVPTGILVYPLSVLILILLFWGRLYLAALIWGIMAFGDGFATIFGATYGKKKLPWSRDKSYVGFFSYLIFGTLGASFLLWWTAPKGLFSLSTILLISFATTLFSAIVETIHFGLNDNFIVPLLGAGFLFLLLRADFGLLLVKKELLLKNLGWGALISLIVGGIAILMGFVDLSGFLAGVGIGTTIYAFTSLPGFVILFSFFLLGSGATKMGYRRKERLGMAEAKGGARGAVHALGNCALPSLLAFFAFISKDNQLLLLAFITAFATATADTLSTEMGGLYGKNPILITTLRRVPPGTEGAISFAGTLSGVLGAVVISLIGYALHLISLKLVPVAVTAAFFGNLTESFLGAILKGKKEMSNEGLNFLNTVVGAFLSFLLFYVFYS